MIDITKGLLERDECQEKIVGEFYFVYHFLFCFFPFWTQAAGYQPIVTTKNYITY